MRSILLACLIGFLASSAHALDSVSELHGGRWIDVPNPTAQNVTDPALPRVEEMLREGRSADAFKSIVVWLKANPTSPLRDRGVFLAGEALYQYGDRIKSFFYFDELMDEFPDSTLYSQALEKQYQIADEYLNGYQRRLFKVFHLGAQEEAVEMLYRIQARSPGSPLAEKSLLRTANYYYASSDFDLAADAYAAYVKAYPRSLMVPRVKLRQAYANLAQFRGLRFDATPVVNAKAQLQDIVTSYPDIAASEDIPAILTRIDTTFTRKLETIADFYRRTDRPDAAAYTIGVINKQYPNFYQSAFAVTSPPTTQPQVQP